MSEPAKLATLAAFPQEYYAQMLVDGLSDEGIVAEVSGGITGGFRAEAPGMVKVLVKEVDLARAKSFFVAWEHESQSIDWDEVDVGKMEDDEG